MPEEETWLFRPVMEKLCRYESVIDGTLDLGDIKTLNNILDVWHENERRLTEAAQRAQR